MNITYPVLLKKLEQELASAKNAGSTGQMREYVASMKTLCELILESGDGLEMSAPQSAKFVPSQAGMQSFRPQQQEPVRNVQVEQSKPMSTDDGANGDSIFDF
ncbi:YwdI family protein [Falsibacillus pallidus]|uniref:YwdI family protein n=1 Tax=Falsibacillus pallidus TaxID=493781 RepID=UPI003D971D12